MKPLVILSVVSMQRPSCTEHPGRRNKLSESAIKFDVRESQGKERGLSGGAPPPPPPKPPPPPPGTGNGNGQKRSVNGSHGNGEQKGSKKGSQGPPPPSPGRIGSMKVPSGSV